jgi:3-dehydroquinate synthase
MPITVPVALGDHSYDICIDDGGLARASGALAPYLKGRSPIIVTDTNVEKCQLPRLIAGLEPVQDPIILAAGEGTKDWANLESLCDMLLDRGVQRDDTLIALGGGVIGDLVGFAAAIVKRGCNFIQIPTTLLAQVDSSVGGKTAINARAGKNLIGRFHQPVFVLVDPQSLESLPVREMRAGYAEIVKYGLINDRGFFTWCEENAAKLLAGDRGAQIYAIEKSVRAKAAIVAADERETQDLRALLNLGHTFGHALEADQGFCDSLLHGEAVAAGMALAFRFSAATGRCAQQDADRVAVHLRAIDLPDGLAAAGVRATGTALVDHMRHDKKMSGNTLPFILARSIGDSFVDKTVALKDVEAFLDGEAR